MTEKKKFFSTIMVHECAVKGKDEKYHHIQTVLYVEGRLTKAGVTVDDKKANLAISVQNQTKALNRALQRIGVEEGALFHSESDGNAYDLLHAVCWNQYAKERLGKVPAGSVVGLFGDLRKNTGTDGKVYVALYVDDFKELEPLQKILQASRRKQPRAETEPLLVMIHSGVNTPEVDNQPSGFEKGSSFGLIFFLEI